MGVEPKNLPRNHPPCPRIPTVVSVRAPCHRNLLGSLDGPRGPSYDPIKTGQETRPTVFFEP
jgi:hypothetical protein